MVRWGLVFVVFEGVPLCQEVVVTLVTRLDPSGRVHGTGPGRSGQVTQRRVEGLLRVRHLLGEYVRQGALLEVVAAKVANLVKIIRTYHHSSIQMKREDVGMQMYCKKLNQIQDRIFSVKRR